MEVSAPVSIEQLARTLGTVLGDKAKSINIAFGEVTVVVSAANYLNAATLLRESTGCRFEQLMDLCGLDYSEYRDGEYDGLRYCVAVHLLSVSLNQRVRL